MNIINVVQDFSLAGHTLISVVQDFSLAIDRAALTPVK